MSAKTRLSYVPAVPWPEHLEAQAHRYPYVFPTAADKGPHPLTSSGDRCPGGEVGFHKRPKPSYMQGGHYG